MAGDYSVEASGGVRFVRAGDRRGEPALFLPAAGWTGAEGLAVARAAPHLGWHLLDLPGTGGSQSLRQADARGLSRWLAAFCERQGITAPHLAGHSLGGYVALAIAAEGQIPLRSLLLIDGGAASIVVREAQGWQALAASALDAADRVVGGRILTRRPGPPAPPEAPDSADAIAHRLRVPVSEDLLAAAADRARPGEPWNLDSRAVMRLGLLGMRTWGMRSLARVTASRRVLVALFPRGPAWAAARAARTLAALEAAGVDAVGLPTGHYVFWDDPEAFAEAARDFYGREPSRLGFASRGSCS